MKPQSLLFLYISTSLAWHRCLTPPSNQVWCAYIYIYICSRFTRGWLGEVGMPNATPPAATTYFVADNCNIVPHPRSGGGHIVLIRAALSSREERWCLPLLGCFVTRVFAWSCRWHVIRRFRLHVLAVTRWHTAADVAFFEDIERAIRGEVSSWIVLV